MATGKSATRSTSFSLRWRQAISSATETSAKLVLLGEGDDLGAALDRAVVVDQLGEHADRLEAGQPAEIDRRLGVAGAHEHAAVAGDQRKDVAGADEIGGADIGVGERADGVAALLGGDAGGQAVAEIDRDGEGGAERGVVVGDHRLQLQAARRLARHRRADDAGGVADDEADLLRRGMDGGDDQVALVLAVVVVGDDDDLAALEGSMASPPRSVCMVIADRPDARPASRPGRGA